MGEAWPQHKQEPFNPIEYPHPDTTEITQLLTSISEEVDLNKILKAKSEAGAKEARKCIERTGRLNTETVRRISANLLLALERLNPNQIKQTIDATKKRDLAQKAFILESFYKGFFGTLEKEEIAQDRVIQRVAEFAVFQSCFDYFDPEGNSIENGVYYPTADEDLHHGIDGWLKLDGKSIAMQVKCLHMSHIPDRFVVPLSSNSKSIEHRLVNHPDYKDASYFRSERSRQEFIESGQRMLTYCKIFDNVVPAYVIIPNQGKTSSLDFYYPLGLPKDRMAEQLGQELAFLERQE